MISVSTLKHIAWGTNIKKVAVVSPGGLLLTVGMLVGQLLPGETVVVYCR
jgi:hypothetical protein